LLPRLLKGLRHALQLPDGPLFLGGYLGFGLLAPLLRDLRSLLLRLLSDLL
jgi:hypothetical protein